jgi:2'-5' RNA ligase
MTSLMTWLVPAFGPERDRLAATIGRLAAEHGAPRFQPHVTMVGTFDSPEDVAIRTLGSLAIGVPSFEVTFAAVGHEQTYFRSLYLCTDPSPQLTALHEAGRRAWALDLQPYMPHLSLLYSDVTEEQKRPIIDALDIALPLTIHLDAVELWADDHLGVRGWRRVSRVPFSGLSQNR